MLAGARLALSWLTVLPVRQSEVDRALATRAITLAPFVGLLLGLVAAGVLFVLDLTRMPGLLAGLLTVGLLAVLTRGMHLDGLADAADGLGCYGPPERALAVMRDGGTGPFAVVTLIVTIGAQAAAFDALSGDHWWAVVVAVTAGRAAFTACCVRGIQAARPDGLGALVAGTQPAAVPVVWLAMLTMAATVVDLDHPWLGPVAVLAGAGVTTAFVSHTRRRLNGITGDVLGAASEVTTTVVAVTCTLV
ncbi:adenosylcobinamide-GDP ribazoletransferase [Actinophytocola gossypii]|uniref:Adenosylcobinamide-GDP ribazoletransferase n=1 Tax=Actinophytocola gossypii TaxID=2812003 RepID=A0ABT2JA10_9PSEU|nr:adenosylcobinamide-GDP ribazoletransferase [Actinophytocola gossypii]MCT2584124.1 adenosylcobinamide-GDP ribazoletransferase [Actinophytocola gossypii]